MREALIRSKILKYLNSLPHSEFEVSPPGSHTGKPDITGSLRPSLYFSRLGVYIAIEVKQPGKRPTPAQEYKMRRLREAGAIAFAASSVVEVEKKLRAEGVI